MNDENTAVNDLIARVSGGPLSRANDAKETLPASPRARALGPAASLDAEPSDAFDEPPAPGDSAGGARSGIPTWAQAAQDQLDDEGEHMVGTLRLSRDARGHLVRKLALPTAALVLVGGLVGAYIARRDPRPTAAVAATSSAAVASSATPPSAAPSAPPAEAAIVPLPSPDAAAALPARPAAVFVTPDPAPAPPALIDVRIDSIPIGATVMLVDRGTTQLVGNTPIAAAIDPSREYDLVLTYAGKPTKVAHLDPRITQRITVALDGAAPASAPPRTAPAEPPAARRAEPTAAIRKEPAAAIRKEPATASRKEARAEPSHGTGTLMISTKPPCEIFIDGNPTGLTTPQRAIALSAGRHKVTLVNADKDIKRTVTVQIAPNATEKVIEDLMQ